MISTDIAHLTTEAMNKCRVCVVDLHNLKLQASLLKQYMDALRCGHTYFWCIPSMNTDKPEESCYLVLQLMKHSKNVPILEEVKAWVKGVNENITFVEIREWTKHGKKKGTNVRGKGLLFDCRNKDDARTVFSYLKEIAPRSYPVSMGGKHKNASTNFVRYVNNAFAAEYMRVQSMEDIDESNFKPRPLHKFAKKPQGPDFDYVKYGCEPSLDTMSRVPSMKGIGRFGEFDHILYSRKNRTNSRAFVTKKVEYEGEIYDVIHSGDNTSMIQNDCRSLVVSNSVISQ